MYNSPMDYCQNCKQYVVLDQTRSECATEHHCTVTRCLLRRYFMGDASVGKPAAADCPVCAPDDRALSS